MMAAPSPDENGQLIYQAALYSNADLLADLLRGDYGRRLDFTDAQGRTALHVAAANGHLPCIQLLVKAGGNFLHTLSCRREHLHLFPSLPHLSHPSIV